MIGRKRARLNRIVRLSDEIASLIFLNPKLSTQIILRDEEEAKVIFERVPRILKGMVEFQARKE